MSHTEKPDPTWNYRIMDPTLGRSYALNASMEALVALVGSIGIFVGTGRK